MHCVLLADRDLGGFWRVVDLAQGGVALVHVTCWGRTTHVGGPRDARLQDYQVSSVRCHRFVTVTAAQKISFISNPRAGRPYLKTACFRARARDAATWRQDGWADRFSSTAAKRVS